MEPSQRHCNASANVGAATTALPYDSWRPHLDAVVRLYASKRQLSIRQRRILESYLNGEGDKEIASRWGCSLATIHEHWRRMGRKVGGTSKHQVVADFHQFLGGNDSRG